MLYYMVGYIHPFYDGNGRLNRFISCCLLSKTFHPIVAYRLSCTIKQNKASYYDAFDYVDDRSSSGDLPPFIIILTELVHKSILLFIFYFVQNALFSPDPFTIKEPVEISKKSGPTIRRMIDTLARAGIPVRISRRGHAEDYRIDLDTLPSALKDANL